MTGKFEYNNNWLVNTVVFITTFAAIFGGASIIADYDIPGGVFLIVILMFVLLWVEVLLLGRCSFIANNHKLIFRVGPITYKYSYSEIKSAEVKIGFTRGRYGMYPHVELVITFTNGETETFCDSKVSEDVLSTPEKHKEFLENHQFTTLSNYINERAGR